MGTHATHEMHANSRTAWATFEKSERKRLVIAVYRAAIQPLTDREVMQRLGFTDMNLVRPTVTRLIESGHLAEIANVTDGDTGRAVRCCTTTSLSF